MDQNQRFEYLFQKGLDMVSQMENYKRRPTKTRNENQICKTNYNNS